MSEQEKKINAFAETGLSDWEAAAREELKGEDPWKKLSVMSNGLQFKPIYGPGTPAVESFLLKPATTDIRGARAWFNSPRVVVTDPATANAMALEHLQAGADGIFFELRGATDFQRLLKKIEWPFCALHFVADSSDPVGARALNEVLADAKGEAAGAWFGPSPSNLTHPTFRFGGLSIDSTSPDAIAASLSRWLGSESAKPSRGAVSIELGTDFFLDIAALRALRIVWERIYKGKQDSAPLYLHANSRPWKNAGYEPHGNLLKATSAAMAAVLGGADALTIDPEDLADPTQRRVARNVAILLREESRLAKVADPLAGCYFIDDLTVRLSDRIWSAVKSKGKP